MLELLTKEPERVPLVSAFYGSNPAAFICDWGCTYDPRNVRLGIPVLMPLVLFPRQVDLVEFVVRKWRAGEDGIVKKCRDIGFTWVMVSLFCTLGIFNDGFRGGLGSRKAEYVDTLNEPKALLPKARDFMRHLPWQFRRSWTEKDSQHMRLQIPDTNASIGGEAGSAIGRGDRTSAHLVDEFSHFEPSDARGALAALSQTTNCCIYGSSVNGMNNAFAEEYHSKRLETFDFEWWQDPRKTRAWYDKERLETDPIVFAQEVDCDWHASVEGVVIPAAWVVSAIDAHTALGINPTGDDFGALDVADEGRDTNAMCGAKGVLIYSIDEWSGKGSDVFYTTERAFSICDARKWRAFRYDADGIGANVRGDARVVNERREERGTDRAHRVEVEAFRGSEAVIDPEGMVEGTDRTNKDFFYNRKAQAWWSLRERFRHTHLWRTEHIACDPDKIVSIDSKMPLCAKLKTELSQPTYTTSAGKILINKAPEGAKSPNLADSVMMRMSGALDMGLVISNEVLRAGVPRWKR